MQNKKAPSKEQQMQAFLRQIQVERKQLVLGVIYNAVSAGAPIEPGLVDEAFALADHYIERCYPIPDEKEEK